MATKVKSLDHTRFVITADNGHRQSKTMYYAGGRAVGNQLGDWCTDLGGAVVYNDLHEAQKLARNCANITTKFHSMNRRWHLM